MVYITYNGIAISYSYEVIYYNYKNSSGKTIEPFKEFMDSLNDKKLNAKIRRSIELLKENGHFLKMPFTKYLDDGIYELRTIHSNNIVRILYFYDSKTIVITNCFLKKTQKLPNKELLKALKYKEEYFKDKEGE